LSFDPWPVLTLAAGAIYLAGLGVAAARLFLARARLERIARASAPCHELGADVRLSPLAASPFASAGGLIVLPRALAERMPAGDLALIVAHERAHIARRDPAAFWALAWIDALLWINPFVRRQSARCRLAAELACDAAAVADAQAARAAYAGALVAAVKHVSAAAPYWAPGILRIRSIREISMRLTRVMSTVPAPRSGLARAGVAAAALLVVPLAGLQLVACASSGGESPAAAGISGPTAEVLQDAIEMLNAEDYAGAELKLGELELDRLSPYERSRVEQIYFNIEYTSENYDQARSHLEQAIATGGLNEEEVTNLRYQIAQTYMVEERWAEGAQALETWFQTQTNPNSQAYYLLAVAYYSMGDLEKALPAAEKAVELAEQPQESWLQLVVALYLQSEPARFEDAVPLLEQLTAIAPQKKDTWVRLSSVYGEIGDYPKALAAMEAANDAGLLTEDAEIKRLAELRVLVEAQGD
jgi:tetratricopeptide (TPR) repeat protein